MKRWLSISLLSVFFCFCALVLGIRYVVFPLVPQYRPALEDALSEALARPVKIGQLRAAWHGLEPWLEMQDFRLLDAQGQLAFGLPSVSAGLSWSSIPSLSLRLSHLVIDNADLDIHRDALGKLFVAGIEIPMEGEGDSPALAWLLQQGDIQVGNSRITWVDHTRSPMPLKLTDLNVRLSNLVNLHRAAVTARVYTDGQMAAQSGAHLLRVKDALAPAVNIELQARFFTPLLTLRPADISQWNGEVYVNLASMDATAFRPWGDLPGWLQALDGDLRAWLEFDRSRITRVTVDPNLQSLRLYNLQADHSIEARDLTGRLEWRADHAQGQEFQIRSLRLTVPGKGQAGPLTGQLQLNDHVDPASRSGRLQADLINLDVMTSLLSDAPLPLQVRQAIAAADARGTIEALDVRWGGDWREPKDIRLSVAFKDAGMQAFAPTPQIQLPGFSGLSGELSVNSGSGQWKVQGRSGHAEIRDVLQVSTIPFERLYSTGSWTLSSNPDRWLVLDFGSLEVERGRMRVGAEGELIFGRGEMPLARLSGSFNRVPVTDVAGLMPLALGPETLRWMNAGLTGGIAEEGRWRLRGDLWHFPFADRSKGEFSLSARIQKGEVLFDAGWPAIRDIDGELKFVNDALTVTAKSAKTRDVPLSSVTVRIPSLDAQTTELLIDGGAQAPLADMVRYVNTSPVSAMLEDFLKDAVVTGPGKLSLNLRLPLDDLSKLQLKGLVTFADNDVFLMRGIPQLSKGRGQLEFSESGLSIKGLTATALGAAVRVDAQTRPDDTISIRADGIATAGAIKRYLGLPATLRISGQTRYVANVQIRPGAGMPDISVESNLQGLASDLPIPLAKQTGDVWPFEFRMLPTVIRNGNLLRDEIRVALASAKGSILAGRIERDRSKQASDPVRGALAIGEPMVMPDSGIRLNISLPKLDLDHWQRTQLTDTAPLSDDSIGVGPESQASGSGLMPDRIVLKTQELVLGNKRFNKLNVAASRQKGRWSFDIAADEGRGTAVWTPGSGEDTAGKIQLNFAKLTIPDSQSVEVGVAAPDPTDLFEVPALDITVDDFALGTTRLGRLRLNAFNQGEGSVRQWILRDFQISNPDVVMSGKGDWRRIQPGVPRRTRIEFRMDVANAGRLLDRVGMEKVLRAGAGTVTGNLQWRGPPQAPDYPSMGGNLALDIKDGQFLKAEPGVARLLGILSLQSLPRRLTLDFSDIFAAGFAFDQIFATAALTDGVLVTRDFKMRGTGASVLMEGQVDVSKETQDLHAVILPEINAAGGTLVYSVMMANPAVGLASFLAQLVLKDPLSKAFSYDLKVSGTWDDPVVEKVERGSVPATQPGGGAR